MPPPLTRMHASPHRRCPSCRALSRTQGWFEAPISATYIFMLRHNVESNLTWSGDDTAAPRETLARSTFAPPPSAPFVTSTIAPPSWPILPPENASSTGVSRPVELVGGHRYWMMLECKVAGLNNDATCAVGTRVFAPIAPRSALLGSSTRRWLPRTLSTVSCSAIADKTACCATIDKDGDMCVPAVTAFAGGAVCAGRSAHSSASWSALQQGSDFARCPFHTDPITRAAPSRTKLAVGTPCSSVTDRVACCAAIDGRVTQGAGTPSYNGESPYEDAPCVPAVATFSNGAVCESVSYAFVSEPELAQSAAACTELGSDGPLTVPFGTEASVATEVQRLTLTLHTPSKLVQEITFTRADCAGGLGCDGEPLWYQTVEGTVELRYEGQSSATLPVGATAAQIKAALLEVPERTYADANVSSIVHTDSTVVWTIELTVPWHACGSAPVAHPLLSVGGGAKVVAETAVTAFPPCMDGGIDVSMTDGSAPSVFVPANATPDVLTASLNELFGATSAAEGVLVTRFVDTSQSAPPAAPPFPPSATASFTITFLAGGARPVLHAVSSASQPLLKRTYAADFSNSTTSTDVNASFKRIAPGGIDLTPIPARYLSAPTDQAVLRLRLGNQTTARCAAPKWELAHLGCFVSESASATNGTRSNDAYAGQPGSKRTFPSAFSLERCALHCQVGSTF